MRTLADQTEFCKVETNLQGSEFQTLLGFKLAHLHTHSLTHSMGPDKDCEQQSQMVQPHKEGTLTKCLIKSIPRIHTLLQIRNTW